MLPRIYIGQPAQLVPLVQLLCYEITLSFEAFGKQLPPWRGYAGTVGRWLSKAFVDVPAPSVAGVSNNEAAASVSTFLEQCSQLSDPNFGISSTQAPDSISNMPGVYSAPDMHAEGHPMASSIAHGPMRISPTQAPRHIGFEVATATGSTAWTSDASGHAQARPKAGSTVRLQLAMLHGSHSTPCAVSLLSKKLSEGSASRLQAGC